MEKTSHQHNGCCIFHLIFVRSKTTKTRKISNNGWVPPLAEYNYWRAELVEHKLCSSIPPHQNDHTLAVASSITTRRSPMSLA